MDTINGVVNYEVNLTPAEEKFYDAMAKFGSININREVTNAVIDISPEDDPPELLDQNWISDYDSEDESEDEDDLDDESFCSCHSEEEDDFSDPIEFVGVGAALGGGFVNTAELHVLSYDEAMAGPDKEHWEESIDMEHDRMNTHRVFTPQYIKDIPKWAKVLSTTWSMKKKSN